MAKRGRAKVGVVFRPLRDDVRRRSLGAGRAGADAVPPDEPGPGGAEGSPETDVAPEILEHDVSERAESLETDMAPPVVDRGAPPAAGLPTPETCSDPERDHVTSEDLH
jgi:hypothetical protein